MPVPSPFLPFRTVGKGRRSMFLEVMLIWVFRGGGPKRQERRREREERVEGRGELHQQAVQRGPDGWTGKCPRSLPGGLASDQLEGRSGACVSRAQRPCSAGNVYEVSRRHSSIFSRHFIMRTSNIQRSLKSCTVTSL